MFGYRVPRPDEAMLISGGKSSSAAPFRVVTGHGSFVMPFFRKVGFLSFSMFEAQVQEPCTTKQGIQLTVKAVIAAKVGSDEESIVNAAQRFLADQQQMAALTGRIFAGHLRSIVGSMTVEQLITERQALATEVLDASKDEMAKIGLIVDALQISEISDNGSGYIAAMAAPHNAAIQQQAKIAQSQADQLAAKAQQESLRQQSQYERDTTIAQAGYRSEQQAAQAAADQRAGQAQQESLAAQAGFESATQAARAKTAQAGPLAQAQAAQQVIDEQTKVAQRQAILREQQLVSEVVKPAQAEAERIKLLAVAEAERTRILAEAAASSNRVALDQQLIAQLPVLVEKAAAGLASANVTVLNGSSGMSDLVSGLAGQGMAIFEAIRGGIPQTHVGDTTSSPGAGSPGSVGSQNGRRELPAGQVSDEASNT